MSVPGLVTLMHSVPTPLVASPLSFILLDINECVTITVTLMHSVPTPLVASPVPVMIATWEMDPHVWVSSLAWTHNAHVH